MLVSSTTNNTLSVLDIEAAAQDTSNTQMM